MHTVKKAIILAAGFGQRMLPLTLETPKPLIKVKGQRFIDSIISGLWANGIREIYVVTGHLKEKFSDLPAQYPGLHLIYNPHYNSSNNISSLYAARDHLEDAMVLDADLLILNPAILNSQFERSGYNCVWTDKETSEWLLTMDQGIVTRCSRTGGASGWQLYSVSRWTAQDARKLRAHLELEFDTNQNRQIYWDDVALFCHPQEYTLGIRPMDQGSIVEIDSLEELAQIDSSYQSFINERKKA